MSSKKTMAILSSVMLALASLAIALVPQGLEAHAASSVGSIVFGSTASSTSAATLSKSSFTTSGVTVSAVTVTKAYSSGTGYAARLGTGSAVGSLKFTFSANISVSSITVNAWLYGSDSGSILKVATSSNTSYVSNTITSQASAAYNYSISGTFTTLTLTTAAAGKRVNVTSIFFNSSASSSSASSSKTSASSSKTSSSNSASSSKSSSSSSSSTTPQASVYRIAPVTSNGTTVNVYNVSYTNGLYHGAVVKTLT